MPKFKDLTGMRFGILTVLRQSHHNKHQQICWLCVCDCGKETTVTGASLVSGGTRSCGYRGHRGARKHGRARMGQDSPEYRTWQAMHTRCRNRNQKSWKNYGGRGISVCDRWVDFQAFLADMGPKPSPRHTIERINNDGPTRLKTASGPPGKNSPAIGGTFTASRSGRAR